MEQVPPDLIDVGYVAGAWGIRGAIKVTAYSDTADALRNATTWWLEKSGASSSYQVLNAEVHGNGIAAQLVGFADRSAAEKLKGARVAIPRSRFPVLGDDEFYWVDLIGLEVVNEAGELLGVVTGLNESAAHQILEVSRNPGDQKAALSLIPFVGAYVKAVDLKAGRIAVDWGLDY